MLKVGDKIIHYVDEIEAYRTFEVTQIGDGNRYTLKGLDTSTNLSRVLDNNIPHRIFNYFKI